MKSQGSHNSKECGTLYVVSTPIGNLEDITLRALRILEKVVIIAAENVAHTRGLCGHYGIKTRLTRYHQYNQRSKVPELLRELKSGNDVALVTDAGSPGISDPGALLVGRAFDENIRVVPIPGASAVIAGLSVSGLSTERFVFLGFLPNKSGKRKKELKKLIFETRTMVFFEAPHRLKAMLTDFKEILGNRQMVMLREMTKVFEEIRRGPVSAILGHLTPDRIRGEFTLVAAGSEEEKADATEPQVVKRIEEMLKEKMSVKDIAGVLSSEEGLKYRQIYRKCLDRKKALGV
ncbi:MAG: 16S rRNA (cytidine(1402)-2'-O)-methyltransferase [Desulfobulbaceae bacterium]|nr:16S rRNA (cytidine(1402)-2'-O)-methyltransferase [Desulfobulbaceae bacterium]